MSSKKKSAESIKVGPYEAWEWKNPKFIRLDVDSSDGVSTYPMFVMRDIVMCGCPGFKFRGVCRHKTIIEAELKESNK